MDLGRFRCRDDGGTGWPDVTLVGLLCLIAYRRIVTPRYTLLCLPLAFSDIRRFMAHLKAAGIIQYRSWRVALSVPHPPQSHTVPSPGRQTGGSSRTVVVIRRTRRQHHAPPPRTHTLYPFPHTFPDNTVALPPHIVDGGPRAGWRTTFGSPTHLPYMLWVAELPHPTPLSRIPTPPSPPCLTITRIPLSSPCSRTDRLQAGLLHQYRAIARQSALFRIPTHKTNRSTNTATRSPVNQLEAIIAHGGHA